MEHNLFEPHYTESLLNGIVSENLIRKRKTKSYLYPEENCDNKFEILQGRLRYQESIHELDLDKFFEDFPECKTIKKKCRVWKISYNFGSNMASSYQTLKPILLL